jgi:hypothetical protein
MADMARRVLSCRALTVCLPFATAGAVLFFFCLRDWGWGWDGFWLGLSGLHFGTIVGLTIEVHFPRWRGSDNPSGFGALIGAALLLGLWLWLPEETMRSFADVIRTLAGASTGFMCGLLLFLYSCEPSV